MQAYFSSKLAVEKIKKNKGTDRRARECLLKKRTSFDVELKSFNAVNCVSDLNDNCISRSAFAAITNASQLNYK
jgi:hypothetical protein